MKASAYAKVNLALAIYPRSADGYHPLAGIFQSVSLSDTVVVEPAADDSITVHGGEAPQDDTNLAWRAVEVARRTARVTQQISLQLSKNIPSGAGLGGGSADAAAVLGMLAGRFRIEDETTTELAESLGADVPFSLVGGTKLVEGRGERLSDLAPLTDFALGIVVAPFSLSTPEVFAEWDRLDGPTGEVIEDRHLPPSLRGGLPIRNDLFPAAISLDARVGEWRDELTARWNTGVAMTGSGSALFSFFTTIDEARGAVASIDMPTRATEAVLPVGVGWQRTDE